MRPRHGAGRLTAFLSTYLNRVDRKGRVSVPAAYRGALASSNFQGIIAYPSMTEPVIEAFGAYLPGLGREAGDS